MWTDEIEEEDEHGNEVVGVNAPFAPHGYAGVIIRINPRNLKNTGVSPI